MYSGMTTGQIAGPINKMISQKSCRSGGPLDRERGRDLQSSGRAIQRGVSQWVSSAALLKPYERQMLINIANEWGPDDSTVWRDAYLNAVAGLRAAGILNTLIIDSGMYGKDWQNILKFGQTIFDADPQHNIVFGPHL